MAYILVVNPVQIQAIDLLENAGTSALILATIFRSFTGTTLFAFWTNILFAQAPGMGLNLMFGSFL
jgi:AGZA family xanthine/uracil permease-like MFS transporter